MAVSIDSYYLVMFNGEKLKLYSNLTTAWSLDYGTSSLSKVLALSSDETFLLSDSYISSVLHLDKVNSTNGQIILSKEVTG